MIVRERYFGHGPRIFVLADAGCRLAGSFRQDGRVALAGRLLKKAEY